MSVDAGEEYPDVYEATTRRARKERKCHACGEQIRRGDLYHTTRWLFEGSWDCVNRCARCEAMYRILRPLMGEYEACDARLNCGHTWQEKFREDPPPHIQALPFLKPDEAQELLSAPTIDAETASERVERVLQAILARKAGVAA